MGHFFVVHDSSLLAFVINQEVDSTQTKCIFTQMSVKESKQVAEDKQKLTEHFIQALPQLLLKVNLLFYYLNIYLD